MKQCHLFKFPDAKGPTYCVLGISEDSHWLQPGLAMTSTILAHSSVLTNKKEKVKNILRQKKRKSCGTWQRLLSLKSTLLQPAFQEKALSSIRLGILLSKINQMGERLLTLPPQMHPIMTFLFVEASTPQDKSVLFTALTTRGGSYEFLFKWSYFQKNSKISTGEWQGKLWGKLPKSKTWASPHTPRQPVSLFCSYGKHTDEPRIWSHLTFSKKGNWMRLQILMSQTSPKTGLQTNQGMSSQ